MSTTTPKAEISASFARRLMRVLSNPERLKKSIAYRLSLPTARALTPGRLANLPDTFALDVARVSGWLHLQKFRRPPIRTTQPLSLLVDVRITQGDHNERGISRYTSALAIALAQKLPGQVAFLLNPQLPEPEQIKALSACGRMIRGEGEIKSLPAVSHFIQCCLFDLTKTAEDLFPIQLSQFNPELWTVAYDLIPKLYAEKYLDLPDIRQSYLSLFHLLSFLDGHLAISAATAKDLVVEAGVDPAKIATIYGTLDTLRWSRQLSTKESRSKAHKIPHKPFWLYVGGGDFRKNIESLLKAFALYKKNTEVDIPALVVLCSLTQDRRLELEALSSLLGLKLDLDIFFTGRVDDEDMIEFYRRSFAVVFPSLYEGLGLPILEAYYFGVPVIAGDNSSLREITPPECRFNAESPEDIAISMREFASNPDLRRLSLDFGSKILMDFEWARVADRVIEQFSKVE